MNRLNGIYMLLAVISIFFQNSLNAQETENTADKDLVQEVAVFRAKVAKEKISSDMDKNLWVNFRVDTFTIQKTLEAHLANATARYDASFAWSDAVSAYNEMIGRYYNLLMEKMIEIDRPYLEASQKDWLEYKQSEQILNQIIGRKEYNKSGVVNNETYTYTRMLNINKERAVELFHYLLRANNR